MIRAAAVLLWIHALGLGGPCIPAIRNALTGGPIPFFLGFPAYGNGPFERHGIHSTAPLLAGFLVVCVLEGIAGWLLWNGQKSGALLAIALLPFGAIYWWGFSLPIPPLLAVARTVLIAMAWNRLT